jgi:hypothetical protein
MKQKLNSKNEMKSPKSQIKDDCSPQDENNFLTIALEI